MKQTQQKKLRHVAPRYHGYKGGYTSVTFCPKCCTVALYGDAHPVRPCKFCGGEVHEGFSAKWIDTTPKFKLFSPSTWNAEQSGEWQFSVASHVVVHNLVQGCSLQEVKRQIAYEEATLKDLDFTKIDLSDLDFTKY